LLQPLGEFFQAKLLVNVEMIDFEELKNKRVTGELRRAHDASQEARECFGSSAD
jgi:hypothetical protein